MYIRIFVNRAKHMVEIRSVETPKENVGQLVLKRKFENSKEALCIADMYMEDYLRQGIVAGIIGV